MLLTFVKFHTKDTNFDHRHINWQLFQTFKFQVVQLMWRLERKFLLQIKRRFPWESLSERILKTSLHLPKL